MNNPSTRSLGRSFTRSHGYVFLFLGGTESDWRLQEDPFEDMKNLDLGPDDSMLVITSAGDNALHYAIAAQPRRVGRDPSICS